MSRSSFRIKVDLSRFYNDARQFCWVFIDGTKISQICQLKQHITKIFNIIEPFHLLLNETEYLPPVEDVRILKESETIVVIAGSGLENGPASASNACPVPKYQSLCIDQETTSTTFHHKEAQTVDVPITKNEPVTSNQQHASSDTMDSSQQDSSVIDVTFHSIMDDTENESVVDSKATDSNITEDCSMIENLALIPRKKRIRRRKAKKQTSVLITNTNNDETKAKKPKIIDSFIISSGKHIRFETVDNEDHVSKQSVHEICMNGSCSTKSSSTNGLSTLLSLRQASTPLTFANKRPKEEVKSEKLSDDDTTVTPVKKSPERNSLDTKLSDAELERLTIMQEKAQVNDLIAFKMLKIGSDYTPQVSDFIVAEVVSSCPSSSVYTFKIIHGMDQIQVPIGKFTLPTDESESVIYDTITINWAQVLEPRLVRKSCTSSH